MGPGDLDSDWIPENERDSCLRVLLESQITGPQTNKLTTSWKMQKTKKNSQVPQTVDSSNEGPEDFRHQLPHLFFTFTEQSQEMSSCIWDGDPHYPETLNCGAKNPEKNECSKLQQIPQFYGGGENLRICGGLTGPKNTKKWPQKIRTPMSFLQGAMHIPMVHIMRNLRGKCLDQKKCPLIGESLRIFDIFQHRSKPSGHRCLR